MTDYGSIGAASAPKDHDVPHEETAPLLRQTESKQGPAFWSQLVFGWFTPLLHRGNERQKLDPADLELIPLPPDCQTDATTRAFDEQWAKELTQPKPSLMRALYRAYGADYIRAGFLKLVHDLCVFVGPNVLHAMIVFLRDPEASLWWGLFLTATVTVSQTLMSLCLRHYFFKCYGTGLRLRSAVVMAVYRKALVLSAGERQTRTLGEITNLMSIDAQRLQGTTTMYAPGCC